MVTESEQEDWVSNYRTYFLAWGLPSLALLGTVFLPHPTKTIIWTVALTWMGVACLLNARRCGRRHCYLTGPFFLLMAILGLLHGFQILWFGPSGWILLWVALVVIGGGILWYLPEKVWGKYRKVA